MLDSRRRRSRAFVACAALAVALHVAFLDGFGGWAAHAPDIAPMPLSVRTIAVEPAAAPAPAAEPAPVAVAAAARPRRQRPQARAPAKDGLEERAQAAPQVSAGSSDHEASVTDRAAVEPATAASAVADAASAALEPAVQSEASSVALSTIPGAGDRAPPVYPTRLPPAATLHYQVRRGFLRGDGEILWQPAGETYRVVLEARVAGLTLLVQTSEGAIDGNGLAPVRFLDQRARRAAQAANFNRDSGRITFSATAAEWPLVAGAQDRLSWMIQLAGIVAADPALLHEGSRITMAVVGARGDAAIWSLRYAGEETVETAGGTVSAVKLVREGRAANDTTAEIWLDPARSYLPAHATLRNASGASEYDLLFDRIDP
jgi:hypothetical protein